MSEDEFDKRFKDFPNEALRQAFLEVWNCSQETYRQRVKEAIEKVEEYVADNCLYAVPSSHDCNMHSMGFEMYYKIFKEQLLKELGLDG